MIVGLAVVVGVGLVALVVSQRLTHIDAAAIVPMAPPAAATPAPTPVPLSDIARADLARVVTVEAERSNDEELGTGWLFDARGDFVTNAHVIEGQLTIRLRDRHDQSHVGRVLGVDATADIAVIRSTDGFAGQPLAVDPAPVHGAPFPVVVIGSGRATGQPELTLETLSATGQDVPVDSTEGSPGANQPSTYHDMLQLDGTRIYQGNSGGPVIDQQGDVIGIVTLASKSMTEAFAIPVSRVLPELTSFADR